MIFGMFFFFLVSKFCCSETEKSVQMIQVICANFPLVGKFPVNL